MKKKFGDRHDGKKIKVSGFDKFLYFLKQKRSESEVYISKELDVTELKKYLENKKKENKNMTYFHVFSTGISKVIYNRPKLNRFIIGGNYYERNEVTLSFVAKTDFTDNSKELLTVIRVDEKDNINTLSDKISGNVLKIRSNSSSNVDNVVDMLGKLPKFIMRFIVWIIKVLDNHDMLPRSLTDNSVYHSTVLLSNLGSIKSDSIYHNLTNFGTNSILVTIGEIKEVTKIIDGKNTNRYVCNFGITLDERIADGMYYVKSINMLQDIFNNPEMLEDDVSVKIYTSKC